MRISDWSSDVCSSDLLALRGDTAFDRWSGFHLGAKLGQQVKAAEPARDQGDSSDPVQRGIGDLPLRLAGLAAKNGVDQRAKVALAMAGAEGCHHRRLHGLWMLGRGVAIERQLGDFASQAPEATNPRLIKGTTRSRHGPVTGKRGSS